MIEVYGCDINEIRELLDQEEWIEGFSKYRMEKIRNCKNKEAREQSFAAGLLLNAVLKRHGSSEKEAKFSTNEHGKRILSGADVNLSHKGNYVVCAYGKDPVGIDIEKVSNKSREKIAEHFFTLHENQWLKEQLDYKLAFCRLWTRKESFLKKVGTGITVPLNSFDIPMEQSFLPGKELNVGSRIIYPDCYFKEYSYDSYNICVCAGENNFPDQITFLKREEIAKM